MDYSRIIDKPFFVQEYSWDMGQTKGALASTLPVPSQVLINSLARVPFDASTLFRMRGCFVLQVSGTPMHQGTLVAAALPRGSPTLGNYDTGVNQYLQAPHAFLSANESTPVCIEVPFYSRTHLRRTHPLVEGSGGNTVDYASLGIYILNPLSGATGATNTVTISVHFLFKDTEFYVPRAYKPTWVSESKTEGEAKKEPTKKQSWYSKLLSIPTRIFDGLALGAKSVTGDFIDSLRGGARSLTGFHNPNETAISSRVIRTTRNFPNNVDQPTLYEKLDQHAQHTRIVDDYLFHSEQDEMDMQFILSKPAYDGTFSVDTNLNTGQILFTRPIWPAIEQKNANGVFMSPLRTFYEISRYWRGTLKLHIQANMTNFQYCKLLVVKDYTGDVRTCTAVPLMEDVVNTLTDTLEFSAGGQIQTIELPFCSQFEQLECTKWTNVMALLHGVYRIYLLQPLTTNGTVPIEVNFNVYMSVGDDFQYYGYAGDNITYPDAPSLLPIEEEVISSPQIRGIKEKKEMQDTGGFVAESETTIAVSDQKDIINEENVTDDMLTRLSDFKPMTNVRDYIRRVTPLLSGSFTPTLEGPNANYGIQQIDIARMLSSSGTKSPTIAVRDMFFGRTGGMRFKVIIDGSSNGYVWYFPPGLRPGFSSLLPTIFSAARITGDTEEKSFVYNRFIYNSSVLNPAYMIQELPTSLLPDADGRSCRFEFEIPNMNMCRFFGGPGDYARESASIENDMGTIMLAVDSRTAKKDISYTILGGFSDEARFGFQCCVSPKAMLSLDGARLSPYMNVRPPYRSPLDTSMCPMAFYG